MTFYVDAQVVRQFLNIYLCITEDVYDFLFQIFHVVVWGTDNQVVDI